MQATSSANTQPAINSSLKTVKMTPTAAKTGSPCPESPVKPVHENRKQSIGLFDCGEVVQVDTGVPVIEKVKDANDMDSSSDSFCSLGSLAELGREIMDSLIKKMDKSDTEQDASSISEQTESSEVHSVYKNSGLKVRGIDVDNLVTKDGKKFDIYHLFKARYQLYDTGKTKISNSDVVGAVNMLTGKQLNKEAINFLREGDNADYRKNTYDAKNDSNYTKFQELWKQVNQTKQNQPVLPPTLK